jgi:riboflavin kinase / FMN adenylyltransferase
MDKTVAITIGDFDGVHRGHQAIFSRMRELADKLVVITFNRGDIYSQKHKKKLLKAMNVVALDLNDTLSTESPAIFLERFLPFDYLILGTGARFGHRRSGSPEKISEIGSKHDFAVEYIPLINSFSSSKIRKFISQGMFEEASEMLGRPYSIYSTVEKGLQIGLGYPTANINIDSLSLPPFGVYDVTMIYQNVSYPAIANLGLAPTIGKKLTLEVHVFDKNLNLYGKEVEVIFNRFVRPEQHFNSIEELKKQIALDISYVKKG